MHCGAGEINGNSTRDAMQRRSLGLNEADRIAIRHIPHLAYFRRRHRVNPGPASKTSPRGGVCRRICVGSYSTDSEYQEPLMYLHANH